MDIPVITTVQMREVDRLVIDVYGIEIIQLMENAGRHLAHLARQRFLSGKPVGKRVIVLAGSGGNGGGGLVAARYLRNWGAEVMIYTTKMPVDIIGIGGHQMCILNQMKIPAFFSDGVEELPEADVVIDAIIGYSLRGVPRGPAAHLIRLASEGAAPILSLDVPSGMDATSGEAFVPYIKANATLTLALPKVGLFFEPAKSYVGELYLADIGIPPDLYENVGLQVGPIFSEQEIIRI